MPHAPPWKVGVTKLNLTTLRKLVVYRWMLWLKVAETSIDNLKLVVYRWMLWLKVAETSIDNFSFFYNIFYLLKNKIAFKKHKHNKKKIQNSL